MKTNVLIIENIKQKDMEKLTLKERITEIAYVINDNMKTNHFSKAIINVFYSINENYLMYNYNRDGEKMKKHNKNDIDICSFKLVEIKTITEIKNIIKKNFEQNRYKSSG